MSLTLRCSGALLAGGASSRMGCPKADIEFGGMTLAQRAAATLQALTAEVVQVGGEPIAALDLPHFPDRRQGAGPLAGVETALARVEVPLVVLAVDLPLVPPELLEEALRSVEHGAEICAPQWSGRWHPLCAVYSPGVLAHIEARLDAGNYGLQGLLEELGTALPEEVLTGLGDPAAMLHNINTREDLERARAFLA